MSWRIDERYKDRHIIDLQSVTVSKEFELNSTEPLNEDTATEIFLQWIRDNALQFYYTKPLSRVELETTEGSLDKQWVIRCEWTGTGTAQEAQTYPKEPGCPIKSCSSEGGTAHITQAISETRYPVDQYTTAPNFGGGIGYNGETFEGVDVVRPAFQFSITKTFRYEDVTAEVQTRWANCTGCVNSDTFDGFDAGTVLFCGQSGQSSTEYNGELTLIDGVTYQKATNLYTATFKFRCSPNVAQYTTAGVTLQKNGWDYVWVLRSRIEDTSSGQTVQVPFAVYKNVVYPSISFANLMEV